MSYRERIPVTPEVKQEQPFDDEDVVLSQDELDDVAGGWSKWTDSAEKGVAWEW